MIFLTGETVIESIKKAGVIARFLSFVRLSPSNHFDYDNDILAIKCKNRREQAPALRDICDYYGLYS